MPVVKGSRYGIRTIDDLRARSVMADNGCWMRPATMQKRKSARNDSSVWCSDLQQALSLGAAVFYLTRGHRLRRGMVFASTCGTRGCANPEHRKHTTAAALAKANATPCSVLRALRVSQSRRKNSRISDDDVRDIIASPDTAAELAKRYGISKSYVYGIKRGTFRQPRELQGASVFTWKQAA